MKLFTLVLFPVWIASAATSTRNCRPPNVGVPEWYYNDVKNGKIVNCTSDHDDHGPWAMLNVYRSGGTEGTHWKYIEGDDYSLCLKDWWYFNKKGTSMLGHIDGYATRLGDKKNKLWCALPVYRKGGVRQLQWDYCKCSN